MTEPSNPAVVHVAGWAWTLGGLQSALGYHVEHNAARGYRPQVIALFDRTAPTAHPLRLGARAWTWVGAARRRFARLAAAGGPDRVLLYHDGWGLQWWADVDGAARRMVYLHTEVPHLDDRLRMVAKRADGILSASHAMIDRVRRVVPEFPKERCFVLPYFVEQPATVERGERADGASYKIGYAGRIAVQHKRVDRLPELIAELDRTGLDYTLEVLGEGEAEADLRQRFGGHSRVRFLGRRSGDAYWATLATWDCLALVSAYEGFGRVTMEGMMVGALPVMPNYSPAAREVLGPLAKWGEYPTGDMAAAARCVVGYARMEEATRAVMREQARRHFDGHSVDHYRAVYQRAIETVRALPATGKAEAPARWGNWLPLGVHTRLFSTRF
ncbi:MAG: glycosyltransferase [Candidatus Synoicihabitans palmerolidicus]|nr:glycosyltransferase [Candidatus Synoicihabitans palmerolidicus]